MSTGETFFILNIMHHLLISGQIEQQTVYQVTRQNVALLLQQHVPIKDNIAKSPVYIARDLWNNLPVGTRNIIEHECHKITVRNYVQKDYVTHEESKL